MVYLFLLFILVKVSISKVLKPLVFTQKIIIESIPKLGTQNWSFGSAEKELTLSLSPWISKIEDGLPLQESFDNPFVKIVPATGA